MAKRSPKKALSAPFLITFAGAAALVAPACGSEVITNPPFPDCPVEAPAQGSACSDEGLSCDYTGSCGQTITAICGNGDWAVSDLDPSCLPDCPIDPPAPSSACTADQVGLVCEYPDACVGTYTVQCVAAEMSAFWNDTSPPCNPPPPQPCSTLTTQTDCSFGLNCRWLEPGCGMSPIAEPRCVDDVQCTTDADCAPGEACKTVDVLPECAQSGCNPCCNACSEEYKTCM